MNQLPKDARPQLAFAGRSNVGKSSLLNRLVGQKHLAKVSATPGKTRSLNFFLVNDRFYFVDLPGYGFARAPIAARRGWGKLIEQYLTGSMALKGLMLLLDCRREPNADDLQLIQWLSGRSLPTMVVLTKSDKLSRDKVSRKVKQVEKVLDLPVIPFSTVSGVGKDQLLASVFDLLRKEKSSQQ